MLKERNITNVSGITVELSFYFLCCLNRESKQKSKSVATGRQKVLVLGSGYVSAPVVDYLSRQKDTQVTVGMSYHANENY